MAMALLHAPAALSVVPATGRSQLCDNEVQAPCGVQLRRNADFHMAMAVRGFSRNLGDVPNISIRSHLVEMKKGYGAFGKGVATLEKFKLDSSQSTTKVELEVDLEGGGGGGGVIGNNNFPGGGDGGDGGGDDDDYFGEDDGEDNDDDGDKQVPEVFDRKYVEAILQEWSRTINDLPPGIHQSAEWGLISSAQMARFCSFNAKPTMTRSLSRMAPESISRAFIGRVLADPGFLHKLAFDEILTIGNAVWWECQHRGERMKQEWDVAAVNVLTLVASTAAMNWALAPSRSYGSTFQYEFQNSLQKLPNYAFDKSYPFREFDMSKRVFSFFYKTTQLSLVVMLIGCVGAGLSNLMPSARTNDLSVSIPSITTSASSYGAFLGLSGNVRYQLLNGAERLLRDHFRHLRVAIFFSAALRVLNIQIGDVTRLAFLGPKDFPVVHAGGTLSQAYRRPSLSSESIAE